MSKNAIIDFDFAVLNGAELLFGTTCDFLSALDHIAFDGVTEARFMAGKGLSEGLGALFQFAKTKKTVAKATRDLDAAFRKALVAAIPRAAAGVSFRNFVKTLADAGVRTIVSTRAELEPLADAFAPIVGDSVLLCRDVSRDYGFTGREGLLRLCATNKMNPRETVAVTGSGFGVRAALRASMPALVVMNERVSYQDFSGADGVVRELGVQSAKRLLGIY